MLELLRNGQMGKNLNAGPLLYLAQEILITIPFLAPVWIIGLVCLVRAPQFRFLGFAYIILIAEMIAFHGKHYYPANIYPVMIAGGAVPIEAWTRRLCALRAGTLAYAVIFGIAFLPFSLPVLPEKTFIAYAAKVGDILHIPRSTLATERLREGSALPGDYADMHGWPELAQIVEFIYDSLTPEERARTSIIASNYGEAAAIDFFGSGHGLPPVLSRHNQYFLWGTHGQSGDIVIDVNGTCGGSAHIFDEVNRAATFSAPYAVAYEDHIPISLCRGIRQPLAQLWPRLKLYI